MTVSCQTAPVGWLTPGPGAAPPATAQAEHDVRLSLPHTAPSRALQVQGNPMHSLLSLVDLCNMVPPPCRHFWTPRRQPPASAVLLAPPPARRHRRSLPCRWAGCAQGAGCGRASGQGSPPGCPALCRCDAGCCSACGGDRPVVWNFCCGGAPCFCSCSCRASCLFPCPCHGCAGLDSWRVEQRAAGTACWDWTMAASVLLITGGIVIDSIVRLHTLPLIPVPILPRLICIGPAIRCLFCTRTIARSVATMQCASLNLECCASCRHVADCHAHTNMVPAPAAAFALAAAASCLTLRNVTSAFFPAASAASTAPVSASVPCQPVVPAWTSLLCTMTYLSVELPATRSARLSCAVPDVPKKVPENLSCWCYLCIHTRHTCRQCPAALQRHTASARSRRWAARWTAAARSASVPWRRSRQNGASGTPS
jgi:hypothetical protein